jgi:hypothetical protein
LAEASRAFSRDGITLPVIRATAEELAEHERQLDLIDRQSGGKALWRTLGLS